MEKHETRIQAERVGFGRSIEIRMLREHGSASRAATHVEFKDVGNDELVSPFLVLRTHEAQMLMDELWHCGLRPSEGAGSAGSLAATERHLNDMRKLAFHALKVPG